MGCNASKRRRRRTSCPPNNLMHSLPTAIGSHAVSHKLFSYGKKNSFTTFHLTLSNIIRCKRMFLNNDTSMNIALSFSVTRKLIL
jgi:hypothetical protein